MNTVAEGQVLIRPSGEVESVWGAECCPVSAGETEADGCCLAGAHRKPGEIDVRAGLAWHAQRDRRAEPQQLLDSTRQLTGGSCQRERLVRVVNQPERGKSDLGSGQDVPVEQESG